MDTLLCKSTGKTGLYRTNWQWLFGGGKLCSCMMLKDGVFDNPIIYNFYHDQRMPLVYFFNVASMVNFQFGG